MRTPTLVTLVAALVLACSDSSSSATGDDGGVYADAGGCPAVPIHCVPGCAGVTVEPTCQNGTWVCLEPAVACLVDAGIDAAPTDGGGDADRGDSGLLADGGFACGPHTCDPATSYCVNDNYPVALDSGSHSTFTCTALPHCASGTPTCACIEATGTSGGCFCTEASGAFTVTCDFP